MELANEAISALGEFGLKTFAVEVSEMALSVCRECGASVSESARMCPLCGCDRPAPTAANTFAGCGNALMATGCLLMLAVPVLILIGAALGPVLPVLLAVVIAVMLFRGRGGSGEAQG